MRQYQVTIAAPPTAPPRREARNEPKPPTARRIADSPQGASRKQRHYPSESSPAEQIHHYSRVRS